LRSFPEWEAIAGALGTIPGGDRIRDTIANLPLRPSIQHGDLARWNLLKTETGALKVLDWEWGVSEGMPGIDLVHFIAQDLRLVERLPDAMVFRKTIGALKRPYWRDYIVRSGWNGFEREMIITCLAFKQGSGHQDNAKMLEASVAAESAA
jgi:RIO-like serine/threonine protein kinase